MQETNTHYDDPVPCDKPSEIFWNIFSVADARKLLLIADCWTGISKQRNECTVVIV